MDRDKISSSRQVITEEAASWFLRIQDGLSQSDFRDWRRWLDADEAHGEAFDAISSFWQEADRVDDLPWPSDEELKADTYTGTAALPLPDSSSKRQPARRSRQRVRFAAAASIAAMGLLGLILSQDFVRGPDSYQTETSEHRLIPLQDGSSIALGAKSKVVIAYAEHVRRIELRSGEAYFKVATDSERPFIVAAGTRTVRALGTEFDVNIGVRDIRVSVVEGRVRVEGPPPTANRDNVATDTRTVSNLSSGEVLDFNTRNSAGIITEVDPMIAASWLDGRLAYVGATLESVIADVNRYSETELIIGDEATKQLIFTGTIFSNDIDNWLAGLEKVFPMRIVPVEGHGILLIQSNS